MNKQELQKEINKTKEHLVNMEKMLAECEYERWKPVTNQLYWYVNSRGKCDCSHFCLTDIYDTDRCENFNCFQTREQAEVEAEKILVRRQLEDIARKLNKDEEICWENEEIKYYLAYQHNTEDIGLWSTYTDQIQGVVYCLSEDFLDVAIQEIGEERLKKYLRGE